MGNEITLDQLITSAKKMKKDMKKITKKANEELFKAYKEDIEALAHKAVEEFYNDYHAKYYGKKRKYDLYNAYKVNVKNGYLSIKYGAEFMKEHHRASNEYIYNLAFVSGWHGGAINIAPEKVDQWGEHRSPGSWSSGDDPMTDGMPLWRKPIKDYIAPDGTEHYAYERWSERDTAKSTPPLDRINELLDDYEAGGYQSTYDKAIERLFSNY